MKSLFDKENVYTAGVFDLFHAGHMERIMIILDKFPDNNLIIGVASDSYIKSFKRTPVQSMKERINTIKSVFKTNKRIKIIPDPLRTYMDKYTGAFYEEYNITDHCQRADLDENPRVYEYIKSKKRFHEIGHSDIITTAELIEKLTPSEVIELGGDNNINFKIGNIVIKKIIHGSIKFIDDAYTQLLEKKLFGVTSYKRFYDIIFIPVIEGIVTHDISLEEFLELTGKINNSGLKPTITIMDVFKKFNFFPNKDIYAPLLSDISHVCHGDLAFTNIIKGPEGITPIDWEYFCYSTPYWDLANFLTSIYIYGHNSLDDILEKLKKVAEPKMAAIATILLTDYWITWSITTKHDYFSKECKELHKFLLEQFNHQL